ncbi:hypothetical protein [Paraburkholderia sp. MM5477-R1]|uniref:hypothetical protein n=1 Tax=Paraburkholderia sp. MM5477-R1 TaxID=2991062 RepID=UPI003D209DB2
MKWMLAVAALAALPLAAYATAAPDASSLQELDARIADAKQAATAAGNAANTICGNAGYAMAQRESGLPNNADTQFTQCMDAMQASNDATGFVGSLYEQRSHLTGQPLPKEYACKGEPSLGAPHPDVAGHYTLCRKGHR